MAIRSPGEKAGKLRCAVAMTGMPTSQSLHGSGHVNMDLTPSRPHSGERVTPKMADHRRPARMHAAHPSSARTGSLRARHRERSSLWWRVQTETWPEVCRAPNFRYSPLRARILSISVSSPCSGHSSNHSRDCGNSTPRVTAFNIRSAASRFAGGGRPCANQSSPARRLRRLLSASATAAARRTTGVTGGLRPRTAAIPCLYSTAARRAVFASIRPNRGLFGVDGTLEVEVRSVLIRGLVIAVAV